MGRDWSSLNGASRKEREGRKGEQRMMYGLASFSAGQSKNHGSVGCGWVRLGSERFGWVRTGTWNLIVPFGAGWCRLPPFAAGERYVGKWKMRILLP